VPSELARQPLHSSDQTTPPAEIGGREIQASDSQTKCYQEKDTCDSDSVGLLWAALHCTTPNSGVSMMRQVLQYVAYSNLVVGFLINEVRVPSAVCGRTLELAMQRWEQQRNSQMIVHVLLRRHAALGTIEHLRKAVQIRSLEMVASIIEAGVVPTTDILFDAVKLQEIAIVERLLVAGATDNPQQEARLVYATNKSMRDVLKKHTAPKVSARYAS
jgi:hypothetical protein